MNMPKKVKRANRVQNLQFSLVDFVGQKHMQTSLLSMDHSN